MAPISPPPKPTPDDADSAERASAAPTPTPFWQRWAGVAGLILEKLARSIAVIVLLLVVLISLNKLIPLADNLLKRFLTSPQLNRFLIGFMHVFIIFAIAFCVYICLAFLAYGAIMLYLVLSARSSTTTTSLRAEAPRLFESLPWLLELLFLGPTQRRGRVPRAGPTCSFFGFTIYVLFQAPSDGDDIKWSGEFVAFVMIHSFQLACAARRLAGLADTTQNPQSDMINEAEEAPPPPRPPFGAPPPPRPPGPPPAARLPPGSFLAFPPPPPTSPFAAALARWSR